MVLSVRFQSRSSQAETFNFRLTTLLFKPLNFLMMLLLLGPWIGPFLVHASKHGDSFLHVGMFASANLTYWLGDLICPEQNVSWYLFGMPFIVCIRCSCAGLGLVSASALYACQFRWGHRLPLRFWGNRFSFRFYRRVSPLMLLVLGAPWIVDAASHLLGFWSGTAELRMITAWLGGLGVGLFVYGRLFGDPARLRAEMQGYGLKNPILRVLLTPE